MYFDNHFKTKNYKFLNIFSCKYDNYDGKDGVYICSLEGWH